MPKRTTTPQSQSYLLRMDQETKTRLMTKSNRAGISMADALRTGGEQYLDWLLGASPITTPPAEDETEVLADFRRVSARVERLFGGEKE